MAFEKLDINLKAAPELQELILDLENKLEAHKMVMSDVGEFASPSFVADLKKDIKLLEEVLGRVIAQQEIMNLRSNFVCLN
tara:strand:+ start:111 stop:353 length:243 start_codon:yes stop_codon:yes gene_type:complete